jgi:hypothetical protein
MPSRDMGSCAVLRDPSEGDECLRQKVQVRVGVKLASNREKIRGRHTHSVNMGRQL